MTNRDRLNNMTNEDLASYLKCSINISCDKCIEIYGLSPCKERIKEWLESEVED